MVAAGLFAGIGTVGTSSANLVHAGTPAAVSLTSENPIQRENALSGTTSWEIQVPSYKGEIEGYPSRESVLPGQRIDFHVSTTGKTYSADVYRIGWYGSKGGRLVLSLPTMKGHRWRVPKPNPSTGLLVCDWPTAFSVTVPRAWTSGFYLVKLTASNRRQAYIPFIVKEAPTVHSALVLVDEIGTSEAYNWFGGKSLFTDTAYATAGKQFAHRAVEVSFLRPFSENMGAGWFLSWEIHMVRWLERRGYDVSYLTELDVNDDPSTLLGHKGIITAGHDEYWSAGIRDAMQNAVNHGVNYANFAANTGYWQSRIVGLGDDPDAIEICYKDFHRDPIHKTHPEMATVTWRSKWVHHPESELTGAMYGDFEGRYGPYPWVVKNTSSWVFKGTHLKPGSSIGGMVGHEEDAIIGGYPHPPHLHVLSASPVRSNVGKRRVANSTLYQSKSGAWVFDASSIDWSWGLDDFRQGWYAYAPDRKHPSPAIERITENILNAFENGLTSADR